MILKSDFVISSRQPEHPKIRYGDGGKKKQDFLRDQLRLVDLVIILKSGFVKVLRAGR